MLKRTIIGILVIVLVLGVMYQFSIQEGKESLETSMKITRRVHNFVSRYEERPISLRDMDTIIRKIGHLTGYYLLAFAIYLVIYKLYKRMWLSIILSIGISIAFAVYDEVYQLGIPGRRGTLFDILVDGVGILLAVLSSTLIITLIKHKN